MKKYLAIVATISLLATPVLAAPSTLYEYFSGSLPSVSERADDAVEAGIVTEESDYQGTAEQNDGLLNWYLGFGEQQFGGTAGGISPSRYKATLAQSLDTTMASTTRIAVSTLALPSGETLTDSDVSDFTVYTINPGAGNEEKIVCAGISATSTALTDCRRGLSYKNTNSRSENVKYHGPGETIIISDDFQFFSNEVAFLDSENTFTSDQRINNTAGANSRLYLGSDNSTYLWHNTTTGQIGFASSSAEFVFNDSGTTFTTVAPLGLTGGELSLATSTYDFILDGSNNLRNATGTIGSGTASGNRIDDQWNNRWNATTTKPLAFTFSDDLTVGNDLTVDGNATTTGSFHFTELVDSGNTSYTSLSSTNGDVRQAYIPVSLYNATGSGASLGLSDNTVYTAPFNLQTSIDVSKLIYRVTSGGSAGRYIGIGIYSMDGNTRYITTGGVEVTSNGVKTTTLGSPITLNAGNYILAWTDNNSSTQLAGISAPSAQANFFNEVSPYMGTAANGSSSGALPSTLGVITGSSQNPPVVMLSAE